MIRIRHTVAGAVIALTVISMAGAVWLNKQRNSISTLEARTAVLQEQIALVAAPASPSRAPQGVSGDAPSAEEPDAPEPIDWQSIAGTIASPSNRAERKKLQERLRDMDFQQLNDEMERARMHGMDERGLLVLFLEALAAKDPGSALDLFCRVPPESTGPILRDTFHAWVTREPAQAGEWLDRQIALGQIDSTQLNAVNPMRVHFEEALLASLIKTNPSLAETRLNRLTEEEAFRVLQTLGRDLRRRLEPQEYAHFARLAREGLPEERRLSLLADAAVLILHHGDEDFSEFLNTIEATPAERSASVATAIQRKISHSFSSGEVDPAAADEIRGWAANMGADGIDMALGAAVGRSVSGRRVPFEDAAGLALHYQETSGSDDALIGFLSNHQPSHCAEARALLERLGDPASHAQLPDCLK